MNCVEASLKFDLLSAWHGPLFLLCLLLRLFELRIDVSISNIKKKRKRRPMCLLGDAGHNSTMLAAAAPPKETSVYAKSLQTGVETAN